MNYDYKTDCWKKNWISFGFPIVVHFSHKTPSKFIKTRREILKFVTLCRLSRSKITTKVWIFKAPFLLRTYLSYAFKKIALSEPNSCKKLTSRCFFLTLKNGWKIVLIRDCSYMFFSYYSYQWALLFLKKLGVILHSQFSSMHSFERKQYRVMPGKNLG